MRFVSDRECDNPAHAAGQVAVVYPHPGAAGVVDADQSTFAAVHLGYDDAQQEPIMSQPDIDPPQLYAAREPIFPRRVHGWFRNLKWVIMVVTLGIYYVTPWIRWNRGPNLPDQAVLVDLANRRFFFFWIEIWPHEFYFVAGLLVMAGLGLFLFTLRNGNLADLTAAL